MALKYLLLSGGMLCFFAGQLSAGAWPRGEGNVFVSSSGSFTWPNGRAFEYPDIYGSGYAEIGISDRLTLGLDLGSSDATRPSKLKAVGFIRYSLSDPNARHQFALDFGAGKSLGNAALRIGASYGAGVTLFTRSGWLSMDAHMLLSPDTGSNTKTLDATLGMNFDHGKVMGMLSAYQSEAGKSTVSFTPSYAHKLNEKRHVEIGVTFDLSGAPDPALKLGIWQDF